MKHRKTLSEKNSELGGLLTKKPSLASAGCLPGARTAMADADGAAEEQDDLPDDDLSKTEQPADLNSVAVQAPGGWFAKLQSTSPQFGRALGWALIVGVTVGVGYAVYRLDASLGLKPVPTLIIVFGICTAVLAGGVAFVSRNHR
jgi:hypothetical protein